MRRYTFARVLFGTWCLLAGARESQSTEVLGPRIPLPVYRLQREGAIIESGGQRCGVGVVLKLGAVDSQGRLLQVARFIEVPGTAAPDGLKPGIYPVAVISSSGVTSLVIGEPFDLEDLESGWETISINAKDLLLPAAQIIQETEPSQWIEARLSLRSTGEHAQIVFGKRGSGRCNFDSVINFYDAVQDAIEGDGYRVFALEVLGDLDKRVQRPAILDTLRKSVVLITCQLNNSPSISAGVIVGRNQERLYVLTARHAVWHDTGAGEARKAEQVNVRFFGRPGEGLAAQVLDIPDSGLDIAVVTLAAEEVDAAEIKIARLTTAGEFSPYTAVMSIGHPTGDEWAASMTEEQIVDVQSRFISFQSSVIGIGSSGGGLFDACGRLIGVVVSGEGRVIPRATRIDRIRELLKSWDVPFQNAIGEPCDLE